jgi:hypothetical protein
MLKEPPGLNFFLFRGILCRPGRTTFEVEYVQGIKTEFKNILGYETGAHMGSIHEKTRGWKYRATVPLIWHINDYYPGYIQVCI